jgi:hypothetical protein
MHDIEPGENAEDRDVPLILRRKVAIAGAISLLVLLDEQCERVLMGDQSYIATQLPPKDYKPVLTSAFDQVITTIPGA